ncbi:MAG: S8 family peptidase, partial [bacterium]|nr:S8 family peptidase [bacterium]
MLKFLLLSLLTTRAYIYPALGEKLFKASPNEYIEAIVHLKAKPDYHAMKGLTPAQYVEVLKTFSMESQRDILNSLEQNFSEKIKTLQPYWIFNGFYVEAKKEVIEWIAQRDDVEYLIDNFTITLEKVKTSDKNASTKSPTWNITKVKADSCWQAGYDGSGIIVGIMDTGVDPTHPALSGKFYGYWYDAVNGQSQPYDDHGHGTHCTGTILGGDGLGSFTNDIGVAPGAKFVSCKIFDSQGSATATWLHNGFQKIAEWKSQGVDIRVVSNSWGSTDITNTEYWNDVLNWRNLEIIPVFAAGNNGPNSGTINTPGSFPNVIAVGATDNNDNIANFSCRGPAPNQDPWNNTAYWPRSDWNFVKPNISAPGVGVPSSVPGGGYESWDGTSMATPHVAGAVAILLQKNPNLDFNTVYSLLLDYASQPSQGAPYPNNDYGWGVLDVYQALINTPSPDQPSIVFLNYSFADQNENSIWDAGETIYITVTVKNNGVDASNVQGTLTTNSGYASISDGTTLFGDISTSGTADNGSDPFVVTSDPATPSGTDVNFNLNITCDGGYTWNYNFSITVGIPGVDYADHSPGNIVLTITKYGTLGYMSSDQNQGSGCKYPSSSDSHLFYGSFAVGTQLPYVIDRYYESSSGDDDDWVTTTEPDGRVFKYSPYPPYYEYSQAIFTDAGGEESKGLWVYQRGHTFNDGVAPNYVILEYTLYNSSPNPINGLYAGLFTDWDIVDYSSNAGGTNATRNLVYLYYSSTFMGTAILNPSREQTDLIANYSVIDNENYVYPYNGLPDNIQINFLNGTYRTTSTDRNADWSSMVSAGPFNIAPYDSVKVAFVVAGAGSYTNLQSYIDDAYARYWGTVVNAGEEVKKPSITIPAIARTTLELLTGKNEGEVRILVYDAKGALVKGETRVPVNGIVKVNFSGLPAGLYLVQVEGENFNRTSKVI